MEFNETDKLDINNLLKALKIAEFKAIKGAEALALARAYGLLERVKVWANTPKPKPVQAQDIAAADDPFEKTFVKELNSIKKSKKKNV